MTMTSPGADIDAQTPEPTLSIGKIAKQFNVTLRALRFYESSGLLNPKRRGTTRLYTQSDCQRLEMILKGRRLGFMLSEIHDFIYASDGAAKTKDLEMLIEPAKILAQIRNLERRRAELDKAIQDLSEMNEKKPYASQSHQIGDNASSP